MFNEKGDLKILQVQVIGETTVVGDTWREEQVITNQQAAQNEVHL